MQKRIQIPVEQYNLMVAYIHDHYDQADSERYQQIMRKVEEKREAAIRHNIYTIYKSTKEPEMKEMARQVYLDKAGIPRDFHWISSGVNISGNN